MYRKSVNAIVSELDTLLPGEYLLVFSNQRHYQLSGLTRAVVLCLREDALALGEIEERLKLEGVECASERLVKAVDQLVEISVLSADGTAPLKDRTPLSEGLLHRYLTLKVNLLSAHRIAPLTRWLSVLFLGPSMRYMLPLILLLQMIFCWTSFGALVPSIAKLDSTQFAWLVFGNYVALLMHELGHASACTANRIRHGPIGFCIYLIYPAFYADVSEAWRLPRSGRAVVDAGGIYMSLLCGSLFTVLFLSLRNPVWGLLAILCDITVFWNLNPFIRMDGYWLLSDALGLQNLMTINKTVTWWMLRRLRGRREAPPMILSSEYSMRSWYIAYYVGFLVFFCYTSSLLVLHYIPGLIRAYPRLNADVAAALHNVRELRTLATALLHWVLGTIPLIWLLLFTVRCTTSLTRAFRGQRAA